MNKNIKFKKNYKYNVVGLGTSLMDFILNVEDSLLDQLDLIKGQMYSIDEKQSSEILNKIKNYKINKIPGGSAANTLAGISALGGKAAFIGAIGDDCYKDLYIEESKKFGLENYLIIHNGKTGHAITFITPDGERTFATHLGAAIKLIKEDVNEEIITNSQIFHTVGYVLEKEKLREVAISAMEMAKKNNVKVSLDFSDAGIVRKNKQEFIKIARKYVDILFLNEEEALAFVNSKDCLTALDFFAEKCEIVIIKRGVSGSVISYNNKKYKINSLKVQVENTNGAGDIYAAGFLYGLVNNLSIEKIGEISSYLAAKIVEQPGARLKKKLQFDSLIGSKK